MGVTPRAVAGLAAVVAACGCSDRPSAPALGPEAVYRNDAAGLRFLTPDGWSQMAKTAPPPGELAKPTRLVAYVQTGGDRPAEFEVYAVDLPDGTDLPKYLTEQRIGPEKWQPKGSAAEVAVNGAAATRYEFRAPGRKPEGQRVVVAFRRAGRVYLFVFTGAASDATAAGAFQRSVDSVAWD